MRLPHKPRCTAYSCAVLCTHRVWLPSIIGCNDTRYIRARCECVCARMPESLRIINVLLGLCLCAPMAHRLNIAAVCHCVCICVLSTAPAYWNVYSCADIVYGYLIEHEINRQRYNNPNWMSTIETAEWSGETRTRMRNLCANFLCLLFLFVYFFREYPWTYHGNDWTTLTNIEPLNYFA